MLKDILIGLLTIVVLILFVITCEATSRLRWAELDKPVEPARIDTVGGLSFVRVADSDYWVRY